MNQIGLKPYDPELRKAAEEFKEICKKRHLDPGMVSADPYGLEQDLGSAQAAHEGFLHGLG